MKLIPKMQSGGSFMSLFADYMPSQMPQPQQQQASSGRRSRRDDDDDEKREKGKLTEKDLFTLLKDVDGLPNEMQALVQGIQRMYTDASLFGNDDVDVSGLASMYAQNLYKLKHANFNKKEYDKAYTEVEKNQGLNEFAISSSGKMVVYDKDQKLTEISVSEFLNNQGEYSPISNSNLLWLRAHDPQYVNNNQIFDVIRNGMGINKVEELIRDRFNGLGTSEEIQSGYSAKVGNQVMWGFQVLNDIAASQLTQRSGMTLDGLYKNKIITKTQKQQAQAALQYIYQTLPENAKSVLQLHSGNSDNPTMGALNVIQNMLTSKMSDTYSMESDYQENLNLDGSKKDNTKESEIKENAALMFLNGRGEPSTVDLIPGDNTGFRIKSTSMTLTNNEGKVEDIKYLDELKSSGYGGILDIKNASMGGLKVVQQDQIEILDPHVHLVIFPANPDGTPDLSEGTIEKKRQADEELLSQGIDVNSKESFEQNYRIINEVYAQYGMANGNNLKYFAVLDGRTNNQALGMDSFDTNKYLESVSDAEFDDYEKKWSREHSKGSKKEKLDLDHNQWYNPADWFGNYDQVYQGLIWIPVIRSYTNALIGTGEKIAPSMANKIDKQEFISQRDEQVRRSYNDPSNLM